MKKLYYLLAAVVVDGVAADQSSVLCDQYLHLLLVQGVANGGRWAATPPLRTTSARVSFCVGLCCTVVVRTQNDAQRGYAGTKPQLGFFWLMRQVTEEEAVFRNNN
jgi:hypothetical protein